MSPPERPKFRTEFDDLQWMVTDDGSLTLWNGVLDESYHSGCGAASESLVVYLANSGVLARLESGLSTRVFEMGFGTGSAFLLTAALAEHFQTPLDFWAIEIRPLPRRIMAKAIDVWQLSRALEENSLPLISKSMDQVENILSILDGLSVQHFEKLGQITEQLANNWPVDVLDRKLLNLSLGDYCNLHLIIGDATQLNVRRDYPELCSQVNAVYFDAFSPETNPRLWSSQVLQEMNQLLVPGGSLTSYCVKSMVRKTMEEVGFSISRLPGPVGGKRQVLLARKTSS